MNNTILVRQYKQTKYKKTLEQIYDNLKPIVQKKAKFIYNKKYYPLSLYYKCKECKICKQTNKSICKKCDKCSCIKGTFNLRKDNLCDYLDVEHDIWIEVFRIIKNYKTEKDFDTYLFACLWEWIPSFINKNFIKSLLNKSLTYFNEEDEVNESDIGDNKTEINLDKKIDLEEILSNCKNAQEKEIIELLLKEPNQSEVAKVLKVSPQYISLVLKKLQERIKILLENGEK